MSTALTTLDYLIKAESEYNSNTLQRVLRFLKFQLDEKNTEVLEYFFALLPEHEMSRRYVNTEFFEMILRSRWSTAHDALAHYLLSHPYDITEALSVLGSDERVFAKTVDVIVNYLKDNPPETSTHVQMLESLALAAIYNNAPDLYEWCYQQSLIIDEYSPPFEYKHDHFCEQAVENGAWWAVKSIVKWSKPYVFYKAFEDASKFAPIEVLENLHTEFPHHFLVEFSGRAAEYLIDREPTPRMFQLVSRIILKHSNVKTNNPERIWNLCQKFVAVPKYASEALDIADRLWAGSISSEPIFFILRILRGEKCIELNAPLLRHISQTQPESYAKAFTPVSRPNISNKFALHSEVADKLMFAINDTTDRLLVENGYDSEKVNALRQNMNLTRAVGQPPSKTTKRKI